MAHHVELEIPPRSDHLAEVRLAVQDAASLDGRVSEQRVDDLRLAVSEACANAFDAHARVGSDAAVHVAIDVGDDAIAVTVTDHAGGFDLDELAPIPPVTDPLRLRHERGLGIPLMRSLVDEVTFTRTADGTAVRLVVHA
ncbi:MAG: ATP-binding protein [Microthrixaceae bacterium]